MSEQQLAAEAAAASFLAQQQIVGEVDLQADGEEITVRV